MYKTKYLKAPLKYPLGKRPKGVRGVKPNPANWEEDALIERDIYYAWLKHQAQARYRGEEHTITLDEWKTFWTHDHWRQRGRSPECLMLVRKDQDLGWTLDNVTICTVKEKGQYYKDRRTND